ncbi:alpha/beta hydrolase family protein [Paenibacillus tarimensis]|uniref:alpha/beta hydrolase family protein n=1 Tax=Paenibacillus tarimensis TaxID=416012 RepID=UPI001F35DECF|nr:hypothetical protein [Paenibacillus tarimensis]MCF2945862.1 hypothetical protein [Paenibacillus tarimensis]
MKPFEICLFAAAGLLLLGYCFKLWPRKPWIPAVALSGTIMGVIHLLFEGARLQMIPLYVWFAGSVIGCLSALVKSKSLHPFGDVSLSRRIILGLTGIITAAVALFVPLYLLPLVILEQPSGPYAVGTASYYWTDPSRSEAFTPDPSDKRSIALRVWYPAERLQNAERAPYAYPPEQLSRVSKSLPLELRVLLNSISHTETHAYLQAPVSGEEEKYPVLLFSPGYGMSNFMYTTQTEQLASHGYIVAAIEHPYYTMFPTLAPDGQVTEGQRDLDGAGFDWAAMEREIRTLVQDAGFAISKLQEVNGQDPLGLLTGKLDLQRLGMYGHSFGGAAAAQVMHAFPEIGILAGVNMDGFPFGEEITNGLPGPFLYMQTADSDLFADKELPPEIATEPAEYGLASVEQYWAIAEELRRRKAGLLQNDGVERTIAGADHMTFSDMGLYTPLLGRKDTGLMRSINNELLIFFDRHVKNIDTVPSS